MSPQSKSSVLLFGIFYDFPKFVHSIGSTLKNHIHLCQRFGKKWNFFNAYILGQDNKPGSVGLSYFGLNNTILNPDREGCGEVATKSRNVFMGYHKEEAKTKEVFDDGWYLSGDLGQFDPDGLLWLTGRSKELIITAGGENIAPILIENSIKFELPELLSNVVVVGDKRKYLTCLGMDKIIFN